MTQGATAAGLFVPPTIIEISSIAELPGEVFGPVLHVLRYPREEMDDVVRQANATGFGLTFGVHSRIDETIERATELSAAGNQYVNRTVIGAVVGVQPFGGHGLSGTGPKAGGPLYVRRLLSACPPLQLEGLVGELSGPVGERNEYVLRSKGTILCVARDPAELRAQANAARATGNRATMDPDDPNISAALFAGSRDELLALTRRLAERRRPDRARARGALSAGIPCRRGVAQRQHRRRRRQCQPDGDRLGRPRMAQHLVASAPRPGWAANAIRRLLVWAGRVGADPRESSDVALQRRLLILLSVGTLPMTVLWSAIYFGAGAPLAAAVPAIYTVVAPINTLIFSWTRNLRVYRFSQLMMTLVLPWLTALRLGGFRDSSAVIIWAALCPLISLLVEDLRETLFWIVGFVVLLVVTAILQPYLPSAGLPDAFVTWFFVLNLGSVIGIVFLFMHYFVGQRNYFQERSETLLLNILPREIAEALKVNQSTIAAHYDAASVLFADVVEFTPMAATMSPLRLVDLLNEVFQCFDDLVEKYDLEKIKTIGDCYMVASGVPRARPDHATALVQLALDMRAAVAKRTFGGRRLAFRIGINSGPVVAGVIGRKKFIYDLWGEAVNLASRMESHGERGTIQITRNTFELVADQFECQPKGTIDVKGANAMEVWHVIGPEGGCSLRLIG